MSKQISDYTRMVQLAATFIRGSALPKLSYFAEDMPKTTPKSVLRAIEEAHELHRQLGIEIRQIADRMAEREAGLRKTEVK